MRLNNEMQWLAQEFSMGEDLKSKNTVKSTGGSTK